MSFARFLKCGRSLQAGIRRERRLVLAAAVARAAESAQAARQRGDDIRLMASLETIGWHSSEPGSQSYPPLFKLFYPDRADFSLGLSNFRSRNAMLEAQYLEDPMPSTPEGRTAPPGYRRCKSCAKPTPGRGRARHLLRALCGNLAELALSHMLDLIGINQDLARNIDIFAARLVSLDHRLFES
jgi:hypothetical protein